MAARRASWARRVWLSLHEPRVVTSLMVGVYLVLVAAMGLILSSGVSTPWDVAMGCCLVIAGGALGAPAAWRGWWGIEAPAAGLCTLGLAVISIEDTIRGLTTDHWIGWPLMITTALILMLGQRVARTWGHTWEPGREPETALRRAQASVQIARVVEANAAARAAEREEGFWASTPTS